MTNDVENLMVMNGKYIATSKGVRARFALMIAVLLAPFWALGQTSIQNCRKQGKLLNFAHFLIMAPQ